MFADILDYLVFCYETSAIYPFTVSYENTTLGDIHKIEELCNGNDDTEAIFDACIKVLGNAMDKEKS